MDPSPESKQEKDEDSSKADLDYSSRSFLAILIGFIFAIALFFLSNLTLFSGGGDVGDPSFSILAILSLIISGIVAFATSLSGIMKCGRLLYEYPALKKDILKEVYINLGSILGIIMGALLLIKLIRWAFYFL